jgi:hypothetical protein
MGEKKRKEASTKNWKKIFAGIFLAFICVMFAMAMILSGMGTSWISSLASVKAGDVVVIDYTVRDARGNPLLTSDQQVYTQSAAAGYWLLGSKQLTVTADQSLTRPLFPIQVITPDRTGWRQFALLASEYDTISHAIIGMKVNEQKKINLGTIGPITDFVSADQMEKIKLNLTNVGVGESIVLPISENPDRGIPNSSAADYLRIMQVTDKTPEGVTLSYNLPSIEVSIVSINNR